jgi:hypothetical protein
MNPAWPERIVFGHVGATFEMAAKQASKKAQSPGVFGQRRIRPKRLCASLVCSWSHERTESMDRDLEDRLWLVGGEGAVGVFRDNHPFVAQELDLIRPGQRLRWILSRRGLYDDPARQP